MPNKRRTPNPEVLARHNVRVENARALVALREQGCGILLGVTPPLVPCGQIDPLTQQRQYCFACNPRLYHAREDLRMLVSGGRDAE